MSTDITYDAHKKTKLFLRDWMLAPIISVWVKFIKNSTYFVYVVQVQLNEKNCLIYF